MEPINDLFKKTSYYTGINKPIDETKDDPFWIRPSDIIGNSTSKVERFDAFISSFGSCERESAAYQICQFFKEHGDRWYPVSLKELDAFTSSKEPDYYTSAKSFAEDNWGHAELSNEIIVFTNRFIERCAGFRAKDEVEGWKAKNVFELNEV